MTHQPSISEFIVLLYQERNLIGHLYESRQHKRLYLKSELLKLCRENPERLGRLINWEIVKPRNGKFELNQSLLDAFSCSLRIPDISFQFEQELKTFKERMHQTRNLRKSEVLSTRKNLIRKLEESLLIALEQKSLCQEQREIDRLSDSMKELQSFLTREQELKVFRDAEIDILLQDLSRLLLQGRKSLENIQITLSKGQSQSFTLATKMAKLRGLQKEGKLREWTNLDILLETSNPILLEQIKPTRPRIASQQVKKKSSLHFLKKLNRTAWTQTRIKNQRMR